MPPCAYWTGPCCPCCGCYAVLHRAAEPSMAQHDTTQHGTAQHGMAWHKSIAQHSTAYHSMVWHSTAVSLHITAQHVVLHGRDQIMQNQLLTFWVSIGSAQAIKLGLCCCIHCLAYTLGQHTQGQHQFQLAMLDRTALHVFSVWLPCICDCCWVMVTPLDSLLLLCVKVLVMCHCD